MYKASSKNTSIMTINTSYILFASLMSLPCTHSYDHKPWKRNSTLHPDHVQILSRQLLNAVNTLKTQEPNLLCLFHFFNDRPTKEPKK